jgi:hypothetical protein
MINSNNSIKTIVRRFVSLPPQARMELAARLLRWRDENSESEESKTENSLSFEGARASFLERFWDEVEAAHADGLYTVNPFADRSTQTVLYGVGRNPLGSALRA